MNVSRTISAAVLALATISALASDVSDRIPVYVDCANAAEDTTGTQLCTDLRDVVSVSPRYRLLFAPVKTGYYTISMVSLRESSGLSAASVVFTLNSEKTTFLLEHEVLSTGPAKTKEQASGLLADLDKQIAKLLKE